MRFKGICLCWLFTLPLWAGDLSVSGKIEPGQIRIGEQAILTYELAMDAGEQVSLPNITDTLTAGVELLRPVKIDTVQLGVNRVQLTLNYCISSYDSGFYLIPAYQFATTLQQVQSRPLGLVVNTVEVNAETDELKDIKTVMDAPFSWKELFGWIGMALVVLIALLVIAYVLARYVFKKKVEVFTPKPQPVEPAHVVALRALEKIKAEKLWQSGQIKLFYTQLTDVVRIYMQDRFNINAMELTSDQIMTLVKQHPEMNELRTTLRQLLELSDLVKFAKFVPLDNENDRSVLDAFTFVEKTAPQPVTPETETVDKEQQGKEAAL